MYKIKTMSIKDELSRDEAIQMNRNKCKNPIFTYCKNCDLIANRLYFITKNTKTANTDTFIHMHRELIVESHAIFYAELKRKQKKEEYKKRISRWSLAIDEKLKKRIVSNKVI